MLVRQAGFSKQAGISNLYPLMRSLGFPQIYPIKLGKLKISNENNFPHLNIQTT